MSNEIPLFKEIISAHKSCRKICSDDDDHVNDCPLVAYAIRAEKRLEILSENLAKLIIKSLYDEKNG